MIFNSNTTSLGTDHYAMAEGYDCSYGCALALVESARNEYKMFRAMLDIDARELQIQRESSGYVAESQIMVLTESTVSGIWNKIKELFKKLAEKLKAIFHTFMSKINGLYMKDKELVKKYSKELYRKSNIGNLEVKWINYTDKFRENALVLKNPFAITSSSTYADTFGSSSKRDGNQKDYSGQKAVFTGWDSDQDKRHEHYCPEGVDYDTFDSDMDDKYADGGDVDTLELKDTKIGGIRAIIQFMENRSTELKTLKRTTDNLIKYIDKIVKEADKQANEKAKAYKDAKPVMHKKGETKSDGSTYAEDTEDDSNVTAAQGDSVFANQAHEMAVAYQNVLTKAVNWVLTADKKDYAQHKAAFMKAVAANNDKLSESTYLDAVAEAAEQEVEDVISSALSKEELSKINNASLNVMDSDVSDDPSKLTYGPDYYTDNQSYVRTSGSVDTDINSKSESAYFSGLFY